MNIKFLLFSMLITHTNAMGYIDNNYSNLSDKTLNLENLNNNSEEDALIIFSKFNSKLIPLESKGSLTHKILMPEVKEKIMSLNLKNLELLTPKDENMKLVKISPAPKVKSEHIEKSENQSSKISNTAPEKESKTNNSNQPLTNSKAQQDLNNRKHINNNIKTNEVDTPKANSGSVNTASNNTSNQVQTSSVSAPISSPSQTNTNNKDMSTPTTNQPKSLEEASDDYNKQMLSINEQQQKTFSKIIEKADPNSTHINNDKDSTMQFSLKNNQLSAENELSDEEIEKLENPMARYKAKQVIEQAKPNIIIQSIIYNNGFVCFIDNQEFREGNMIGKEKVKKITQTHIIVTDQHGTDRKIDF